MYNIISIVRKNNETFFDHRADRHIPQRYRYVMQLLFAILLSIITFETIESSLSSIVTFLSILLGFSFSVLFFIVSSERARTSGLESLEEKERSNKLNSISDEIFYNISYLSIISVLSITLGLIISISISISLNSLYRISENFSQHYNDEVIDSIHNIISNGAEILFLLIKSFFFFLLIEVVFTFIRIIIRIMAFFERRMRQAKGRDLE